MSQKIKPKRKVKVAFEWTSESIEKISYAPPVTPVKFANTDIESIIQRVGDRKKENAVREQKRATKTLVEKPFR